MKKILPIFFILFLLFGTDFYAQCTQKATNFGNNSKVPMYNVNGDVNVTLNDNNTVTLNLGDNFTTASGPDVRVYIINQETLTDAQLKTTPVADLDNIMLGLVSSSTVNQNGAKTFNVAIPQGKDISKYSKVLFYCLNFNQLWDFGSFETFTASNCSTLSTNKTENNNFGIYPNPAKDSFSIVSNSKNELSNLRIFNVLGKIVYTKNKNFDNSIDISPLSDGIYLVEMTDVKNKKIIKRLVKNN